MSDRVDRPPPDDLTAPAPSGVSPEAVRSFRSQLTIGEDAVDPTTWAGSVPQAQGIAPRVRIGRSRWFNLLWLLPIGFVILIVAVAAAKGLRNIPSVERSSTATPAPSSRRVAERTRACRSGWECCISSTCSC
jgi:sulfoxide reductase catalytic subunit YedY